MNNDINQDKTKIFLSRLILKNGTLKNRIIRAATFEGAANDQGIPQKDILIPMYSNLVNSNVGTIITGFNFTSANGHAMQLNQCGIITSEQISAWKEIITALKEKSNDIKICMQISHAGRQTINSAIPLNENIIAPSKVRCSYFRSSVKIITDVEINHIIKDYIQAAKNAQEAGFDGVQVHCAHGYLIHQFFSNYTNRRKDQWGGTIENKTRFAKEILTGIRKECGKNFLVFIKISARDDRGHKLEDTISILKELKKLNDDVIDAVEISYGTMEYALNIFRGKIPINLALKHNPLFSHYNKFFKWAWKKFFYPFFYKPIINDFSDNYNFEAAKQIAEQVDFPIILTGGIRNVDSINEILKTKIKAVSISRPFICEENLMEKIANDNHYKFKCINCNVCTIMCDSGKVTKCYYNKKSA